MKKLLLLALFPISLFGQISGPISGGTTGGGGGSATNVNFYPGQNTAWRKVNGSNVVDITGTITNPIAGTTITNSGSAQIGGDLNVVGRADFAAGAASIEPNGDAVFQDVTANNFSGNAASASRATNAYSALGTNTVYPPWNIAAWGDSMTMGLFVAANQDYTTNLSKITGRTVYDGGVSGETALQIANRAVDATNSFMRPWTAIIWAGRNDFDVSMDNTNTIYTNINRMIQNVTSSRWMVLSVFNKTNEIAGTTEHAKITNFNGMLSAIYTNRYLDARAFIVSQTNGSVQDGLDKANDVPPISLRQDGTHLNYIGYGRLAKYLSTQLPLIETNLLGTLVSAPDIMRALFQRPPALRGPAIIHNSGMSPAIQVVDSNGTVTVEIRAGGLNEYAQETYVGYASGRSSAGSGTAANTALGFETLRDNVSGTLNTAVGFKSLQVTTGSGNTGVGSTALNLMSSGGNNTGIGNEALKVVTTATGNTGVGSGVGENTTGQLNTFVGYEAAQYHTTGGDNVAVGNYALRNSVGGAGNVAVGKNALVTVTNGSDNVAIGKTALQYNTGSRNVAVGYGAGFGDATEVSQNSSNDNYNVFLGFEASRSASVVGQVITNSIALGNGAKITASGQLMVGGGGSTGVVNVASFGGYSSDGGAVSTRMPTNTPTDGYALTAAGTAGYTKWAAVSGGSGNGAWRTNALAGVTTPNLSPYDPATSVIVVPQDLQFLESNAVSSRIFYADGSPLIEFGLNYNSGFELNVPGGGNNVAIQVFSSAAGGYALMNTNGDAVLNWENELVIPSGTVTTLYVGALKFSTNAGGINPDFNKPYQKFGVNTNFTFLAPSNVELTYKTNVQSCVVLVTNVAKGSLMTVTPPANCWPQGNWFVTNNGVTTFTFFTYAGQWTNAVALPLF